MADSDFQGMDTLVGIMHAAPGNATAYLTGELSDLSYEIFNDSQTQVPVRFGILKASGHVGDPDSDGDGVTIDIGYGGSSASYAAWVHENLAAHHKPPTKAKFLEDPFNARVAALSSRVAEKFEKAVMMQFPQSPSKNQQAEMNQQTGAAKTSGPRIAKSKAMTSADVHRALQAIAQGSRRMQRAR